MIMESTARKLNSYTDEEFFAIAETSSQRIELIEGEIIALAVPSTMHQDIAGGLYAEIRSYIRRNKGSCKPMIAPYDVRLNEKNVVQPDVMVICDPSKIDEKRCNSAPDWIIEVTSSNAQTDHETKLFLYLEYGVREYWIVNLELKKVFVYFFEQNPNTIELYSFEQEIPVNIYKDASEPLKICIENLL